MRAMLKEKASVLLCRRERGVRGHRSPFRWADGPPLKLQGGFSLIETMVAMAVLSIMLLGAVGLFTVAQDGISGGAKGLEAMALAETGMERLRAAPFHTLLTAGTGVADVGLQDHGSDGDTAAGDGEYTARRTVQGIVLTWTVRPDQPGLARSRAVTIKVTAEWSDRRGSRRTVRLGMRRANPVYVRGPL